MISDKIKILLIEDEAFDIRRIKNTLRPYQENLTILDEVSDGRTALDLIRNNKKGYDIVIMDFQIAGGLHGESLIQEIKAIDSTIQIIVITKMTINQTDFDFANSLMEAGAFWYGTKYPGDIEDYIYQPTDFVLSIQNAYQRRKLELERNRTQSKLDQRVREILQEKKIIGKSPPIQKLHQQVERVGKTHASVLIYGESGTGKELVATNLHYNSPRRYENFVTVNCGSMPANLIESELFGYERGAFTGAQKNKSGLFEQADGGTVFLDEVSELPLKAQTKLLRVLQEGEIDKIGRHKSYQVDVRIIAATNRRLEELVKRREFREDLFYRMNVLQIEVPALRERREDIPVLTEYFMEKFCTRMGTPPLPLNDDVMQVLSEHNWPGNVRELQNVIQRLLLIFDKKPSVSDVKSVLGIVNQSTSGNGFRSVFREENIQPLREIEERFRAEYVTFVRELTDTDAEAARQLGLAPPNFHRMCKDLGLK
ncbi:MAG: sigma-54 dependent transcriptional regulator [Candidatus Marinimicrobia bacterium]|nr:sigma-54 dependent transcriptional regulator [Candidatus Neomarinimicrobiota bacterium]MCF7829567.1 sigma-54 dependent transcriptional regulator [Candidatus Neomarinimicrobiota bacterium]MCF7882017.1 sigma-54 dependent transcriptional regulator [Candidatus Neomarinimicrobiota bacterium]